MDSLKSLFERGDYELVLSLTEGTADVDSLFYRISSLIALTKLKEALGVLLSNRKSLYLAKPLPVLKANFELRFALKQFEEAYEDIKFYQNEQYISQEVEEVLRDLPKNVRSAERSANFNKTIDEDQIREKLENPKDDFELLATLNQVKKLNISDYKEDLRIICSSSKAKDVRTFALLMLVSVKDMSPLFFRDHKGELINVIPASLVPPFTGDSYNAFVSKLQSSGKDPTIGRIARDIADQYALAVYPRQTFGNEDIAIRALQGLANKYLDADYDLSALGDSEKSLIKEIEETLQNNPPLRY